MTDPALIAVLCVRIGMIMEGICGEAVTVRPEDEERLGAVVNQLQQASKRISVLANAASALNAGKGS